jgi:hypothetical protein
MVSGAFASLVSGFALSGKALERSVKSLVDLGFFVWTQEEGCQDGERDQRGVPGAE